MTRGRRRSFLSSLACAAILAAFVVLAGAAAALAEITVTARDGGVTVTGRYLGYDGRYLRVDTAHGEVSLDYRRVTCRGAECPDPRTHVPTVRLSGSARIGNVLLPAMIERFALDRGWTPLRREQDARHFDYRLFDGEGVARLRLAVRLGSSDEGFADLLAHEADIVLSDRPARPDELRRAAERGLGDLSAPGRARVLAVDALVPVVSARRGGAALRAGQVARAFAGAIGDWAALGGNEAAVTLHLAEPAAGRAEALLARLLPAGPAKRLAPGVVLHETDAEVAAAVAADPSALGLVARGAQGDAQPVALSGRCGLVARAEETALATGDYPLGMPLTLYLPERRLPPAAREFLAWVRSDAAGLVVRRAGFADTGPQEIPLGAQGQRLAVAIRGADRDELAGLQHLVTRLGTGARLTSTFRQAGSGGRLDPQSRAALLRLARAAAQGDLAGRTVLLAGFGPQPGEALARAEAVAAALREVVDWPEDVALEVGGHEDVLAVTCGDSTAERRANRRVEAWLAPGRDVAGGSAVSRR